MSSTRSNSLLDSGSSNIGRDKKDPLARKAYYVSHNGSLSLKKSVELLSSGQAYLVEPPLSLGQSCSPPPLGDDQWFFQPIDLPQDISPALRPQFEDQPVPYQGCDSGYASLHPSPSQGDSNDHDLVPLFEVRRRANSVAEKAEDHASEFLLKKERSDQDDRTSTELEKYCVKLEQIAARYSCPSNERPINSPIRKDDREGSTEGDSSDDTSSPSPENAAWLALAHAKHQMMVSLMRDVYTIFDPQWKAASRSRAGSQAASTGALSQNSNSRTPFSTGKGKRRMQDRDSPPPDGNDEKKRKVKSPKVGDGGQDRLFACFFYKYNAQKYCSNSDTGTKYRSCAGPGFSNISKLKQHLKRNHCAPNHCPRCWLVVDGQTEMALHANAEKRCERREPQALEGVDQDKMRLITETWGVSWEQIYEILFPGAPIPSPYYELDNLSPATLEPSSPRSRELRDFEAYNRTALPILVEANLRAIVESQVAPIEEHVRAMVVEIVRTCQSTVAHNFRSTIAPNSSTNDRMQTSPQPIASIKSTAHSLAEPAQLLSNDTAGNSMDFFREPPHLNAEARASLPGPVYNHSNVTGHHSQSSDSGYGSFPDPGNSLDPCNCSCHDYSNTWNTANGENPSNIVSDLQLMRGRRPL